MQPAPPPHARMASTARSKKDKKEYFDSPEEVERKASELADWIKASKHMIAFTVSQSVKSQVIVQWNHLLDLLDDYVMIS